MGHPDPVEYKYRQLIHAIHCFDEGDVDVDLHWQAFFFQYYTEECVLEKPHLQQPLALSADTHSFILSDSYQLFHTIIHGTIGGTPTIRWIPDAYTILKRSNTIDFEVIFDYAQKRNVDFALYIGLKILIEDFYIDYSFHKLPDTDFVQKFYFKLALQRPKNSVLFGINYVTKYTIAYYIFNKNYTKQSSVWKWIYQKILFWYELKR